MTVAVTQSVIHHAAALRVVGACVRKAEQLGLSVCVAVVDSSARLAAYVRMPGAFLVSSDLAIQKANSAAALGLAPEVVEEVLGQEAPRVREGLLHTGFVLIRGGLPLHDGDRLIGAVGVSGGSESQDVECASAGVVALNGR